jgi:hypothetical protein
MNLILYIAARLSPHSVLAAKLKSGNEEEKEDETMKLIRRMLAEMESF